ncbi:MAG: hypothetical protein FWC97_06110 [Treponema sp.]|nr:hypothetical protein [Treponema sp.]
MSLSQNSVSFETGFRKSVINAAFSFKSKEAVPKTEVLGQPQIKKSFLQGTGAVRKVDNFSDIAFFGINSIKIIV